MGKPLLSRRRMARRAGLENLSCCISLRVCVTPSCPGDCVGIIHERGWHVQVWIHIHDFFLACSGFLKASRFHLGLSLSFTGAQPSCICMTF